VTFGVVREATASARSQPVASLLTILILAAMVVTVMMTTGRTVAAEQQVLGVIDDAGTRTIQIRAEESAGVTTDVLARLKHIEGIEWAAALSAATDATNTLITDGARVPLRYVFSDHLARIGVPEHADTRDAHAFASPTALTSLGMPDGTGAITTTSGDTLIVAGSVQTPDFLNDFEPLVLAPAPVPEEPTTLAVLLVIADSPELVSPLTEATLSVLAADDSSKITVQTSEALAQLRSLVQSQLSTASRVLVLALLAITTLLVAIVLYGLVMMRRRDFGRRRALGASRSYIIRLVLTQTALLSAAGVGTGISISGLIAMCLDDPMPDAAFVLSLSILAVTSAVLAAVVPAVVASRREPLRELRVP